MAHIVAFSCALLLSMALGGVLSLVTDYTFVALSSICFVVIGLIVAAYIVYKRRLLQVLWAHLRTRRTKTNTALDDTHYPQMESVQHEDAYRSYALPDPPSDVEDYLEKRHWLFFAEVAIPVGIVVSTLPAIVVFTVPLAKSWWIVPLAVVIGSFIVYRRWVEWHLRPIELNKKSNIFALYQDGTVWLLLGNSSKDTYPLSEAKIITTDQTLIEQLLEQFFGSRSQSIALETKKYKKGGFWTKGEISETTMVVKHVRDVDRILAIQAWRPERELFLSETSVALQREIADGLRRQ